MGADSQKQNLLPSIVVPRDATIEGVASVVPFLTPVLMIDLNILRENPAAYKQAAANKRISVDIDGFLKLDNVYREQKTLTEQLRATQNAVSKDIPKLQGAEKEAKLAEMKDLASRLKTESASLKDLETEWNRQQQLIPSIPLATVPVGKDDSENVEIRKWSTPPTFSFAARDHATLGAELDLFDVERGVKIAGSRNYFLKGDGARLQHAIMSCAIEFITRRGYTVMDPPHIVLSKAMTGTGYFPGGEEQAYHLDDRDPDMHLIGTSEVSVCSYHSDEILDSAQLPIRYAGYSPCYRREAGTYGKDTQGLYRVHQFYKVEQVVLCEADPEKSEAMHYELLKNAEDFMQLLEIPYRVVDVCSGDLGQGQVWKHDIEAWMPSRGAYGETHSCSSFYDFQARRLGIRYKDSSGKNRYCYTLNNTLIASPRVLIPVLELFQQSDGSVSIPKALRPFMGGQEVICRKS